MSAGCRNAFQGLISERSDPNNDIWDGSPQDKPHGVNTYLILLGSSTMDKISVRFLTEKEMRSLQHEKSHEAAQAWCHNASGGATSPFFLSEQPILSQSDGYIASYGMGTGSFEAGVAPSLRQQSCVRVQVKLQHGRVAQNGRYLRQSELEFEIYTQRIVSS
jgi:hypothetical protein